MTKFNNYSYIFPPRPKNAIPPKDINRWDNNTMLGQPKMNGSNCILFTNGDTIQSMNRHGQRLTNFQLGKSEILELYKPVTKGSWLVINGEYMNKSKSDENNKIFNHKLVIFDLLVFNSDYLIGSTFESRISLLDDIYGTTQSEKDYLYQFTDNIYRVKSYMNNFKEVFENLTKIDMIEGLVMKRKSAKLEMGITENNNAKSMVKARKATKSYKF